MDLSSLTSFRFDFVRYRENSVLSSKYLRNGASDFHFSHRSSFDFHSSVCNIDDSLKLVTYVCR